MSSAVADQNLLFGILAVQMDFATPAQLVAAMNAWVLDKQKPLGRHLVDGGALTPATCDLLTALVAKHLQQHGGSVDQSLAALSAAEALRQELAGVADADVQASLRRVADSSSTRAPRAADADRYATLASSQPRAEEAKRFTILRPHASGGLGRVSVARDLELNREVALKELLDAHADDPDCRARFLQEAEITGGLEHPGVVPIYGLGQYSDGRPFYAMRFVRGDSLRDAIERFHDQADLKWSSAAAQMQLRRLLGRLIDVCNAIDYAHSRGVLHRDLKPGNVMLGQYGETLVVDWGLAKATGAAGMTVRTEATKPDSTVRALPEPMLSPSGSGGSAPTQMGSAVGTPAYMSPEQAAGRLDQLGPASDVYSLGATLYAILTGRPPQEDHDLGIVLQRVQRGEFPAPRAVKSVVPRSLEAICLKAMALRPEDRYATPRAMADDLESWLADEPVAAMPEPLAARGRRWVKKHRALVSTLAGVTLVSLAASLLGVAVLTSANQRERVAKETAQQATQEAERQGERNAELLDLARSSLEKYEMLSKREELQRYGMESLRGELLQAALAFYETLAKQAGESEQARADRTLALRRIGDASWQLGRVAEALQSFEQARPLAQALAADFPDNRTYRRQMALVDAAIGECLSSTQRTAEAKAPLAASRAQLQTLLEQRPDDVDVASILAYGYGLEGERVRQMGDFPASLECRNRQIALLRQTLDRARDDDARRDLRGRLAYALNCRAKIASEGLWQFEPAAADHSQARSLLEQLSRERPDSLELLFSLAQTVRQQGELYSRLNKFDESRQAYRDAIDMLTQLDRRQPNVPHFRQELAEATFLSGTLALPKDAPAAEQAAQGEAIEAAVALAQALVDQSPDRTDRKLALARYRGQLGVHLMADGHEDEAHAELGRALDLLKQLAGGADRNLDNRLGVAMLTNELAAEFSRLGRPDDALTIYAEAQEHFEDLIKIAPQFSTAKLYLCSIHLDRAQILIARQRHVEALRELDQVSALSDQLKNASDSLFLQGGFRLIVMGAAAARQVDVTAIRGGLLKEIADRGEFDLLREQAVGWGDYAAAPSDRFVAAEALAYGAQLAATSPRLERGRRAEIADQFAAAAVAQLEQVRQAGYIRRRKGWFGALSSRPTLADLERNAAWAAVRDRRDFQALVEKIRSESLPRTSPPTAPADR